MLKVHSKKAPKQINHSFFDPPIHLPRETLETSLRYPQMRVYSDTVCPNDCMRPPCRFTRLTRSGVGASAGRDGSTGVLPGLLISTFESQRCKGISIFNRCVMHNEFVNLSRVLFYSLVGDSFSTPFNHFLLGCWSW